jgi:hypothetical protein
MAREVDLHRVHEADPGKLGRQADFPPPRDTGLVPAFSETGCLLCKKMGVGTTAQSRRFVLPSDALSLMSASKSPIPSVGTTTVLLGNIVCVSRDLHDSPSLLDYAVYLHCAVDRQVSVAHWWFETRFPGTAL